MKQKNKGEYFHRQRSGQSRSMSGCLMSPHPLTKFEIQLYYEIKSKSKGVYPHNNLPKFFYQKL